MIAQGLLLAIALVIQKCHDALLCIDLGDNEYVRHFVGCEQANVLCV